MLNYLRSKLRSLPIGPGAAYFLPGSSRSFGPPRHHGFIRDIVPHEGGTVIETEPAETLSAPQPALYGHFTAPPVNNFTAAKPATCVFTLPNARLLGAEGLIVSRRDRFLYDASFWSGVHPRPIAANPPYTRKLTRPLHRLPGTCVSLATDFAAGSYGHLIHDGLLRWHLLRKAGVDLAAADWIYLPRMETPATEVICSLLPLPRERILNYSETHDYEADLIIGTQFPGAIGTIAPLGATFLRDLAAPLRRPVEKCPRVYLSRRGFRRNPVNLDEVEMILRDYGFIILDPASAEAPTACAQAEVVAGIDGSNMANLAFAPAGAHVIVIYPSDTPPQPYHTTMTVSGGRTLHLIMGEPPSHDAPRSYLADFYLPPALLHACLKAALGL